MAQRLPLTVRLDRFEGPLDLLLYLIQAHELDISEISITKITDQYLAYVRLMEALDFDVASEFLVLAATLIHWKSKSLLPKAVDPNAALSADDGELTPEQLLKQLLEHQRFLQAGSDLGELPQLGIDVFKRENPRPPIERVWRQMDVTGLALTFQDLLVRARKRTTLLKKETVSIADKIREFALTMTDVGSTHALSRLLSAVPSRPEIVAGFLACLELSRHRKVRLYQQEVYEEIYLEILETLENFDASALGADFEKGAPVHGAEPQAPAL